MISSQVPNGSPIQWGEQIGRILTLILCSISVVGLPVLLSFQAGRNFCTETLHRRKFTNQTKNPESTEKRISETSINSIKKTTFIPLSLSHISSPLINTQSDTTCIHSEQTPSPIPPAVTPKSATTTTNEKTLSEAPPLEQTPSPIPPAVTPNTPEITTQIPPIPNYVKTDQYQTVDEMLSRVNDASLSIVTGSPYIDEEALRALKKYKKSSDVHFLAKESIQDYKKNIFLFLKAEKDEILFLTKQERWHTTSIQEQATLIARTNLLREELESIKGKRAEKMQEELQSVPRIDPDLAKKALEKILQTIDPNLFYPALSQNVSPLLSCVQSEEAIAKQARALLLESYNDWIEDQRIIAAITEGSAKEKGISALYGQIQQLGSSIALNPHKGWKIVKRILFFENKLAELQKKYGKNTIPELDRIIAENPHHRKGIAQILCKILQTTAQIQQQQGLAFTLNPEPVDAQIPLIQAKIVYILQNELTDQKPIWSSIVEQLKIHPIIPEQETPPVLCFEPAETRQDPFTYSYQARALDLKESPPHTPAMKLYRKKVTQWEKTLAGPSNFKRFAWNLFRFIAGISFTAGTASYILSKTTNLSPSYDDFSTFANSITTSFSSFSDWTSSTHTEPQVPTPTPAPVPVPVPDLAFVHDLFPPHPLVTQEQTGNITIYKNSTQEPAERASILYTDQLYPTFTERVKQAEIDSTDGWRKSLLTYWNQGDENVDREKTTQELIGIYQQKAEIIEEIDQMARNQLLVAPLVNPLQKKDLLDPKDLQALNAKKELELIHATNLAEDLFPLSFVTQKNVEQEKEELKQLERDLLRYQEEHEHYLEKAGLSKKQITTATEHTLKKPFQTALSDSAFTNLVGSYRKDQNNGESHLDTALEIYRAVTDSVITYQAQLKKGVENKNLRKEQHDWKKIKETLEKGQQLTELVKGDRPGRFLATYSNLIDQMQSSHPIIFTTGYKKGDQQRTFTVAIRKSHKDPKSFTMELILAGNPLHPPRKACFSLTQKEIINPSLLAFFRSFAHTEQREIDTLEIENIVAEKLGQKPVVSELNLSANTLAGQLVFSLERDHLSGVAAKATAITLFRASREYGAVHHQQLGSDREKLEKFSASIRSGLLFAASAYDRKGIQYEEFSEFYQQIATLEKQIPEILKKNLPTTSFSAPVAPWSTTIDENNFLSTEISTKTAAVQTLEGFIDQLSRGKKRVLPKPLEEKPSSFPFYSYTEKGLDQQIHQDFVCTHTSPLPLRARSIVNLYNQIEYRDLLTLPNFMADLDFSLQQEVLQAAREKKYSFIDQHIAKFLSGLIAEESAVKSIYAAYLSARLSKTAKDPNVYPDAEEIFSQYLRPSPGQEEQGKNQQLAHFFRALSFRDVQNLSLEQAEELLESIAFVEKNGLPEKWKKDHPYTRSWLLSIFHTKQKAQITKLAEEHGPQLHHALVSGSVKTKDLPSKVINDPLYNTIFNEKIHVKGVENDVFSIEQEGENFRIYPQSSPIVFQKMINREWMTANRATNVQLNLPFPVLFGDIAWTSKDQQTIYLSFEKQARLPLVLEKTAKGWKASLASDKNLVLLQQHEQWSLLLNQISMPEERVLFEKQGKVHALFIPEKNLSFIRDPNHKTLVSEQMKGYGLSLEEVSDQERQKRFTLLPDESGFVPVVKESTTKRSLGYITKDQTDPEQKDLSLFVEKNGLLFPVMTNTDRPEQVSVGNIVLAKIFLQNRQYEKAALYIDQARRFMQQSRALKTPAEIDALTDFIRWQDPSIPLTAEQSAVQLQALSLLEQQVSMGYYTPKKGHTVPSFSVSKFFAAYQEIGIPSSLHLSKMQLDQIQKKWGTKKKKPITAQQKLTPKLPLQPPKILPEIAKIVTSPEPLFYQSMAKDVIPLFAFLWDPSIAPEMPLQRIQKIFGAPKTASREQTAKIAIDSLKFRFQFLKNLRRWDSRAEIESEIHIIATLLAVGESIIDTPTKEENIKEALKEIFESVIEAVKKGSIPTLDQKTTTLSLPSHLSKEDKKLHEQHFQALLDFCPYRPQTLAKIYNLWINPPRIASHAEDNYKPNPLTESPATKALKALSIQYQDTQSQRTPLLAEVDQEKLFALKALNLKETSNPFADLSEKSSTESIKDLFDYLTTVWQEVEGKGAYDYSIKTVEETDPFTDVCFTSSFVEKYKEEKQKELNEISQQVQKNYTTLLELINKLDGRREAQLLSKAEKPLELKDILISLRYNKEEGMASLLAKNPSLTEEDVQTIVNLSIEHLILVRKEQGLTRFVKAAKKVEKEHQKDPTSLAYKKAVLDLYSAANDQMRYDPFEDPLVLILETELNIGMWSAQAKTLLAMRPQIGAGHKEWVRWLQELKMGLGKTYVISPTLLAMMADGEHIPFFVLPENVIDIQVSEISEQLEKAFGMEMVVMPMHRADWTPKRIARYRAQLQENMRKRIPIAWSPTDLQTLINSAFENFYNGYEIQQELKKSSLSSEKKKELTEKLEDVKKRIKEWQKLVQLIQERGLSLGDEIHSIMDLLTTYHLTLGDPEPVQESERNAATFFFQIDFLLGKESSKKKIIERLFDKNQEAQSPIAPLLQKISNEQQEQLLLYIKNDPTGSEEKVAEIVDEYFLDDSKKREIFLDTLAVWKESLGGEKEGEGLYMMTKDAQMGKHYAPNQDKTEGCPADEGRPIKNALFGHNLQRLYYTLHMMQQLLIPEEIVEEDLVSLIKMRRKEIRERITDGESTHLFNSRYGGNKQGFRSIPLTRRPFTEEQIHELTKIVSANPKAKIELTNRYYLKNINVYKNQVATSTHMYGLLMTLAGGMTGTAGNRRTFQHLYNDFAPSTTSIEIAREFLEIAPENQQTIRSVTYSSDIPSVITSLSQGPYGAAVSLLDGTGRLPSTRESAKKLLELSYKENKKITRIVYFENNQARVLEYGQANPQPYNKKEIDPDTVAAIYDTARGTGTDITQDHQRKAVMIVGRHSGWDKTQQLFKRMRKTGKNQQRIEPVVWEQDIPYILSFLEKHLKRNPENPLTKQDLLHFMIINDALERQDLHFMAVDTRIKTSIIDPVSSRLFDPETSSDQALTSFSVAHELFIEKKPARPWDSYGGLTREVNVEDAINSLAEGWKYSSILAEAEKDHSLFPKMDITAVRENIDQIVHDPNLGPMKQNITLGKSLDEIAMANEMSNTKTNVKSTMQELSNEIKTIQGKKPKAKPVPKPEQTSIYNQRPDLPLPKDLWSKTAFQTPQQRGKEAVPLQDHLQPGDIVTGQDLYQQRKEYVFEKLRNLRLEEEVKRRAPEAYQRVKDAFNYVYKNKEFSIKTIEKLIELKEFLYKDSYDLQAIEKLIELKEFLYKDSYDLQAIEKLIELKEFLYKDSYDLQELEKDISTLELEKENAENSLQDSGRFAAISSEVKPEDIIKEAKKQEGIFTSLEMQKFIENIWPAYVEMDSTTFPKSFDEYLQQAISENRLKEALEAIEEKIYKLYSINDRDKMLRFTSIQIFSDELKKLGIDDPDTTELLESLVNTEEKSIQDKILKNILINILYKLKTTTTKLKTTRFSDLIKPLDMIYIYQDILYFITEQYKLKNNKFLLRNKINELQTQLFSTKDKEEFLSKVISFIKELFNNINNNEIEFSSRDGFFSFIRYLNKKIIPAIDEAKKAATKSVVSCTMDVCPNYRANQEMVPHFSPFSQFQLTPRYALLRTIDGESEMIAITEKQAQDALKTLEEKDLITIAENTKVAVVDLYSNDLLPGPEYYPIIEGSTEEKNRDLLMVKFKLFWGISSFSRKEQRELEKYLPTPEGKELLFWYTENTLSRRHDTLAQLDQTPLYRIAKKNNLLQLLITENEPIGLSELPDPEAHVSPAEAPNKVAYFVKEHLGKNLMEEALSDQPLTQKWWKNTELLEQALHTIVPTQKQDHAPIPLSAKGLSTLSTLWLSSLQIKPSEENKKNFDYLLGKKGINIEQERRRVIYENLLHQGKNSVHLGMRAPNLFHREVSENDILIQEFSPFSISSNNDLIFRKKGESIDWDTTLSNIETLSLYHIDYLTYSKAQGVLSESAQNTFAQYVAKQALQDPLKYSSIPLVQAEAIFRDTTPLPDADISSLIDLIKEEGASVYKTDMASQLFFWYLHKGTKEQKNKIIDAVNWALYYRSKSNVHVMLADEVITSSEEPLIDHKSLVYQLSTFSEFKYGKNLSVDTFEGWINLSSQTLLSCFKEFHKPKDLYKVIDALLYASKRTKNAPLPGGSNKFFLKKLIQATFFQDINIEHIKYFPVSSLHLQGLSKRLADQTLSKEEMLLLRKALIRTEKQYKYSTLSKEDKESREILWEKATNIKDPKKRNAQLLYELITTEQKESKVENQASLLYVRNEKSCDLHDLLEMINPNTQEFTSEGKITDEEFSTTMDYFIDKPRKEALESFITKFSPYIKENKDTITKEINKILSTHQKRTALPLHTRCAIFYFKGLFPDEISINEDILQNDLIGNGLPLLYLGSDILKEAVKNNAFSPLIDKVEFDFLYKNFIEKDAIKYIISMKNREYKFDIKDLKINEDKFEFNLDEFKNKKIINIINNIEKELIKSFNPIKNLKLLSLAGLSFSMFPSIATLFSSRFLTAYRGKVITPKMIAGSSFIALPIQYLFDSIFDKNIFNNFFIKEQKSEIEKIKEKLSFIKSNYENILKKIKETEIENKKTKLEIEIKKIEDHLKNLEVYGLTPDEK